MTYRILYCLCIVFFLLLSPLSAKTVVVTDFGVVGDGKTLNTEAFQRAVDACAESGGGQVIVPAGTYLTGTIWLRDNVDFHLEHNAVLLGSTNNPEDYEKTAILYIYQAENVSVSGGGTINGQGWHDNFNNRGREVKLPRPHQIFVEESRHVRITGIKLRDAATWVIRLKRSEWITIDNINLYSHANTNNDGIDIDASNVVITNSIIDCGDDAICFKSWNEGTIVENVTISNCRIASTCNFIKFGTWSAYGFRNITITNCVLTAPDKEHISRPWHTRMEGITEEPNGISGIALEVVDGGFMDQVVISNLTMTGVQTPIFIRLGDRNEAGLDQVGTLKNVIISNIVASDVSRITSSITGIPGHYVENVTIRDVIFNTKGTGTAEHADRVVPQNIDGYPENRMYGDSLPAHGFYVRHAKNIHFENMRLMLRNPDLRPAIVFDDVLDSTLQNIQADLPSDGRPPFRLINNRNVRFMDYHSIVDVDTLFSIEGDLTEKIVLRDNDFMSVNSPFAVSDGAMDSEVILFNNLQ